MKYILGLILLISGYIFSPISAFSIPSYDGFVTDIYDALSAEQEQILEDKLANIEKTSSVEIAILIVDTTDGEDISQVAFSVGEKRGVGKKDTDNGIMFVIAINDRKWFLAVGYGLEGALPDAVVKRMGERYIPAYFKQQQYFSGIYAVIDDVNKYIQKDAEVQSWYDQDSLTSYETATTTDTGATIISIAFILSFILSSFLFSQSYSFGKNLLHFMGGATGLNIVIFILYWIFESWSVVLIDMPVIAIIIAAIMLFLMFIIRLGGGSGGGGSGYYSSGSSGSSWGSSGSSWSSGSSISFGGGSFGGGGAGGSR